MSNPTSKESKMKIGELLVEEGYLTKEQLEQALAKQKELPAYKPLGAICVDLGFISRIDLTRILKKYKKRIYLGELFVNLGLITLDQLTEALERQKKSGKKLGAILIEMGLINEEDLVNCLSIQLGIPKIYPDIHLIDQSLVREVSQAYLRRNRILPAFRQDKVVTVITDDPLAENILADLKSIFRCEIELAIASTSQILKALDQILLTNVQLGKDEEKAKSSKDLVIGNQDLTRSDKDSIVNILNYIISSAVGEGASDIHIEPQENSLRIRYRIDGVLQHKTDLPRYLSSPLTSRIKAVCGLDITEKRRHQDGRIEARVMDKEVDLRVSTYASANGENVVIRILQRQNNLIELQQLGFSPTNLVKFQTVLDYPSGIILVTGPTGSGKTTTLYAAINYLNNLQKVIITVEDPVEYTIPGIVQGQLDPKLDLSYSDFIQSMMRQDPDVLMIGEIRNREAAEATIQAALTGHKVLSTFHTDDTTGALLRLMDMGIDTFLISSTLVSVIAQRLVRIICNKCKEPYTPEKPLLNSFIRDTEGINNFTFYRGKGCPECNHTGFKGRTAIHELLMLNDDIRNAILARNTSTKIRKIAWKKAQLITMREDGFYKATKGITTLEEILRVVFHEELDELGGRTAEEIVALCESQELPLKSEPNVSMPPKRDDEMLTAPGVIPKKGYEGSLNSSIVEGEIYRTRFECATVATEQEALRDLFRRYQELKAYFQEPLDDELVTDFINCLLEASKNLYENQGAEFVEFSLQVRGGQPRIFMEAIIPDYPKTPILRPWIRPGRHILNYLP
jgi:type IV pilus assembly protein PilB